jgi:hypothetical protein
MTSIIQYHKGIISPARTLTYRANCGACHHRRRTFGGLAVLLTYMVVGHHSLGQNRSRAGVAGAALAVDVGGHRAAAGAEG